MCFVSWPAQLRMSACSRSQPAKSARHSFALATPRPSWRYKIMITCDRDDFSLNFVADVLRLCSASFIKLCSSYELLMKYCEAPHTCVQPAAPADNFISLFQGSNKSDNFSLQISSNQHDIMPVDIQLSKYYADLYIMPVKPIVYVLPLDVTPQHIHVAFSPLTKLSNTGLI